MERRVRAPGWSTARPRVGRCNCRDSVGLEQATGQRSNQLNYVPTAKMNDSG